MPGKALAFGPDCGKVLEDLLELYMWSTALTRVLRGLLAEEGVATAWCDEMQRDWDVRMIRIIRDWDKARRSPN